MTTPANTNNAASGSWGSSQTKSGSWGSPQDWAQIASGASRGAMAGLQSSQATKEKKRRLIANLMNSAMNRNAGMFRAGQEYGDEMNDFQSQALQQVARGFVNALQGSTGRG